MQLEDQWDLVLEPHQAVISPSQLPLSQAGSRITSQPGPSSSGQALFPCGSWGPPRADQIFSPGLLYVIFRAWQEGEVSEDPVTEARQTLCWGFQLSKAPRVSAWQGQQERG